MVKVMKKILGILLAFMLVMNSVLFIPVNAKDGSTEAPTEAEQGTQIVPTSIERTEWTGAVYDYNSIEMEDPKHNIYGDGDITYMFDSNETGTPFHTNYSDRKDGDDKAKLPIYMFINLGQQTTFGSFSWYNRNRDDAAKHYKMYINETSESLIPANDDAATSGYGGDVGAWTLVTQSSDSNYLKQNTKNIVNLKELVTTSEILIVVTETQSVVSGNLSNVTCCDFQLYSGFQNKLVGALDRTNWSGYAFDVNSKEEHNGANDGPVANMFDGSTSTLFHTSYANNDAGNNVAVLPVYVFIDLGENTTFSAFSWQNRNNDDAVKHYKMYVNETDTDLMSGLSEKTDGITSVPEGWEKVCESSDVDFMKKNTVNQVNLEDSVTAKQILFEITGTYEDKNESTSAIESYVTCVEFNLYTDKFNLPINMSEIGATAEGGCKAGLQGEGESTAYKVIDGLIEGQSGAEPWEPVPNDIESKENPGTPVYVTIDMQEVYDISKVSVDVIGGRTYNNIVIVTSDTLGGFERVNEHYVLFNTDADNKTGYGEEKELDAAQTNYITGYAQGFVTGRYVRVYINGSTSNQWNHIYEILVYGSKNTDSVQEETNGYLLEGVYSDNTFNAVATDMGNGVYRYVTNEVLGVKAQAKLESDGTYTIRFVSSVASLTPSKVGFDVQKNSGTVRTFESNRVYGKVLESVGGTAVVVEPRTVFENNASDYFFTFKVTGIPSSIDENQTITVSPYWYASNGTKVSGASKTYVITEVIASLD